MRKVISKILLALLILSILPSHSFANGQEENLRDDAFSIGLVDPELVQAKYPDIIVTKLTGGVTQAYIDGPADEASFGVPKCMTVGEDGLLYIMDSANMRVYDGKKVWTEGSLWDQMDIFAPWGLDNERSIESMLIDQMMPAGDRIIVAGRIFLHEWYDASWMTPATYWDDPEQPKEIIFGLGYSFILEYKDGKFSPMLVTFSNISFWYHGFQAFADPDMEDYMKSYVTDNMNGTVSVRWWQGLAKVSIDVAPDGTIYCYMTRSDSDVPPKETRQAQMRRGYESKKATGIGISIPWADADGYSCLSRILPDGTIEDIKTWQFEICGYQRHVYPENIQHRCIWLLPDGNVAIYDGGYYTYSLNPNDDNPEWKRISSLQPEERLWWTYSFEFLTPMRRVILYPTKIGDDLFAVDHAGIFRLMGKTRIQTVSIINEDLGSIKPALLAGTGTPKALHFFVISAKEYALYRVDVPTPPILEGNLSYVAFDGDYVDLRLPAVLVGTDYYIPIQPILDTLRIHMSGTGPYTLTSLTGRSVKTVRAIVANGQVYMAPFDLEYAINQIYATKYRIVLDELGSRILLNVDFGQ